MRPTKQEEEEKYLNIQWKWRNYLAIKRILIQNYCSQMKLFIMTVTCWKKRPPQSSFISDTQENTDTPEDNIVTAKTEECKTRSSTPFRRSRKKVIAKNHTLEQMRLDKKEYYANLLKQNEEKVKFLQEKFEIEKSLRKKRF